MKAERVLVEVSLRVEPLLADQISYWLVKDEDEFTTGRIPFEGTHKND